MNVFSCGFLTHCPTKRLLTLAAVSGLSKTIWFTLSERDKRGPSRLIVGRSAKSKRLERKKRWRERQSQMWEKNKVEERGERQRKRISKGKRKTLKSSDSIGGCARTEMGNKALKAI